MCIYDTYSKHILNYGVHQKQHGDLTGQNCVMSGSSFLPKPYPSGRGTEMREAKVVCSGHKIPDLSSATTHCLPVAGNQLKPLVQ